MPSTRCRSAESLNYLGAPRARLPPAMFPAVSGRYVCITERDTGEGMGRVTLTRATEPFFTTKGADAELARALSMWMASSRNRAARSPQYLQGAGTTSHCGAGKQANR